MENRSSILQGTLDLMVLKTLDAMGPQHGYGLARRIEQISEDALARQSGDHLPLPDPAGAEALDFGQVGRLRQQPQGEVLRHHQGRPPAAAGGDEQLGAAVGRHRPAAAPVAERVT